MSKKKLKERIKELEFENEMLRAMRPYPVYYRVYTGDASYTWEKPESATFVSGVTDVGIDYSAGQDRTVVSACPVSS